jgi:Na+-driven multidrug efflux pump
LRSVGDSASTLYFLLAASVLNVLLDLLFVAVFHWGVTGAAVATNIAQAVSVVIAWCYMYRKYPVFRIKIRELVWYKDVIVDTVKIGLPIALQLVFVALGLTFIQRAVNGFGQVMTASFTVGQRIEMYLHLPCNALQTALATFTGQNVGAKLYSRVRKGAIQGVLLSLIFTLILSIILWCLAGKLPQLFALSAQASEYCYAHLKAVALIVVVLSLYVPLFGVFQGVRCSLIPTIVALCALTLRVIVTYLAKDSAFFGKSIIWWNGLFGFCLGCTITWSIYYSKYFQKKLTGK